VLAVALAFGSGLAYGVSDFLGELTSHSAALPSILLVSQATALVLLSALVISRGEGPPYRAFLLYAAARLSEAAGVAALYRGLAVGKMYVVAPIGARCARTGGHGLCDRRSPLPTTLPRRT
jgi:hypothetical protein